MFITQHSSVTVDGKLSPTVNALLSRGQDFLRFTGSAHGVTFHFELQNNAPVIVMTATSVNPHYFSSHYSKIFSFGGGGGGGKETQTAMFQPQSRTHSLSGFNREDTRNLSPTGRRGLYLMPGHLSNLSMNHFLSMKILPLRRLSAGERGSGAGGGGGGGLNYIKRSRARVYA